MIKQANDNQLQTKYYNETLKKTMLPSSSPYVLKHVKEVIYFGHLTNKDKILDVGCGMGKFTLNFSNLGLNIDGLDLSQYLLDFFEKNIPEGTNINLYCSDIVEAPKEIYNKYNAVVGFFTLHHMNDLNGLFNSVSKLLSDNGRVIIVEPNPLNFLYWLQITFTPGMKWKAEKGIFRMRKKIIEQALVDNSFKGFKIKRYGFFPPFLYNKAFFQKLTDKFEKLKLFDWFLPFQLFYAEKA